VNALNLDPKVLSNSVAKKVTEQTTKAVWNVKVFGLDLAFGWWQIALIVFLIFLLILTIARIRYLYVHWSMGKSALAFLFWGFLLAVIVEGFLILGGRTLFTEVMGWKNPPKPVATALDFTQEKMVNVLGINDEVPESYADSPPSPDEFIKIFKNLSSEDQQQVQSSICK